MRFLQTKNIQVIRFGAITDEALRLKGLPSTEMHEKAFRENLRQELGMAAFAVKNEAKIREDVALYFAEIGYDPLFGARPLRRAIEEKLVDEVAMRIIEGTIRPGDVVAPKVKNDKIVI